MLVGWPKVCCLPGTALDVRLMPSWGPQVGLPHVERDHLYGRIHLLASHVFELRRLPLSSHPDPSPGPGCSCVQCVVGILKVSLTTDSTRGSLGVLGWSSRRPCCSWGPSSSCTCACSERGPGGVGTGCLLAESSAGSRGVWPLFAETTADPRLPWASASTGQVSASACGPGGRGRAPRGHRAQTCASHGTQLPQPLRVSLASPSPPCDPGLSWCPWGSPSQPEAPLVGGRGGPLPLWAPQLCSQACLVRGDSDCLPIGVLWALMGRRWQTFHSVLCV